VSGQSITNAELKLYIEGVSLIWRDGVGGGVVRLADLPEELRVRFGYNEARTKAADALVAERKSRALQEAQAIASQYAQEAQTSQLLGQSAAAAGDATYPAPSSYGGASYGASASSFGGGSVYVHGYTRKDGTYVQSYNRSAPGGGRHR
jgi:hypothetical protein